MTQINAYSLIKIVNIIEQELLPILPYEDKETVYKIVESLEMLILATKAGKPVSFQIIRDEMQEIIPEEDIHDLLANYNI